METVKASVNDYIGQRTAILKRQLHTLSSHFGACDELPLTTHTDVLGAEYRG